MTKQCEICGCFFQGNPHRRFCSKKCMGIYQRESRLGVNNPAWKGGKKEVKCLICEKYFLSRRKKERKFCSRKCSDIAKEKGGVILSTRGYLLVYSPKHPKRNKQKYVPQHVLVMEEKLGRYLIGDEVIHHINFIKTDNRIENLQLCNNTKEHARYNNNWWKIGNKWFKKCPGCLRELEVNEKNFWRRKNGKWISFCKRCDR